MSRRVLSASQIKTFALCQRKWGLKYIDKLPDPPKAGAIFGSKVHKVLEDWLEHGIAPNLKTKEGAVAARSIPHLPRPNPLLYVERGFKFETEKHAYRGFIDCGYVDERQRPVIIDHKTTSDMRWALTEETLHQDVQAVIYAYEAMQSFDALEALLQWNYMPTNRGGGCHPVQTYFTWEQAQESFAHVEEVAEEIYKAEASVESSGIELPFEATACGAFGGCPYRETCNLDARTMLFSVMSQQEKKMDLLAKLKQQSKSAVPTEELPTPAEPAVNPPESPKGEDAIKPPPKEEPKANNVTPIKAEESASKRGPGRPKGSKNKADPAPQVVAVTPAASNVGATKWDFAIAAMNAGLEPSEAAQLVKGES